MDQSSKESRPVLRTEAVIGLLVLTVVGRIISPPLFGPQFNFAPVNAVALFAGAYFVRRWCAFVLPVAAVLVGDIFVNGLYYGTWNPFYEGFYWQYGMYVVVAAIGGLLRDRVSSLGVAGASLASSILFFFVTNFGTWLTMSMYPKTGAGLVACFVAAIPFFQATLVSDLFYSALLFGSVEWARARAMSPVGSAPVLQKLFLMPATR